MDIEREVLDVDILVVGAGPAGLSFGYYLANLIKKSEGRVSMPEIVIADKGSYPGAHSLSGAVLNPRSLQELMPDYLEKEVPFEKKVHTDSMLFLTEKSEFRLPFLPESLKNDGNYIISLNKFSSWLAEQVEAMEINIFPETGARELVVENGRVTGVQTVDLGLDKEGNPRSNFEPGSIIKAKVTILAEGVHGSLTKQAYSKLDIGSGRLPQAYLTGVKEVWEIPDGRLGDGEIIHTFGWPLPLEEYGGGFVYDMGGNMAAVGFAVGLNSPNPTNDPHFIMQKFKLHPAIRRIFHGGKMLHYGAKTIPEGGYFAMPKLYHDGLLLIGDSAGFLNSQKLKGIHLAIKSGMLAAETVFEALEKDDFSAATLKGMENRFEDSWVREELYKVRNFHAGFEDGLLAGLVHSGLQMITGGRGIFDRRQTAPDFKHMMPIVEYIARKGDEAVEKNLKFDNEYIFDKLTDVFRSGTKHEEDQPPHLVIADPDICNTRCAEEYGNPCQYFCPAQVYEMVEDEKDEGNPGQKRLQLTPSNCIHCKTCDIADPYQIITWVTPEGGGGPNYTNL
ncbi:MAG TPA: electron transfer flavoprotein-ubiquinone oxidoreductase [candidate division Zixibacteria bacterium]|nr:electron transfer flavoprotein-ubiquinone oxidoreductase [candidate division Zixibacteria bacterium]